MSAACRCAARSFPAPAISRSKCSTPIRGASSGCASPPARSARRRARARKPPPRRRAGDRPAAGQRQCAAATRRWSRLAVNLSRQTPRRRSFDHPGMGLEARRHRAGRRRAVGAGDGAVQCMAGAVPDLSGRGLADRRRGRRTLARRAGSRDVRLLVRARLFRAGPVLDRLRVPGRCADLRLADAVRGARPARLSRAVHRARLRAGAADLDPGCLARARARGRA